MPYAGCPVLNPYVGGQRRSIGGVFRCPSRVPICLAHELARAQASTTETRSRLGIAATHLFAKNAKEWGSLATTQQMRGSHKYQPPSTFREFSDSVVPGRVNGADTRTNHALLQISCCARISPGFSGQPTGAGAGLWRCLHCLGIR